MINRLTPVVLVAGLARGEITAGLRHETLETDQVLATAGSLHDADTVAEAPPAISKTFYPNREARRGLNLDREVHVVSFGDWKSDIEIAIDGLHAAREQRDRSTHRSKIC